MNHLECIAEQDVALINSVKLLQTIKMGFAMLNLVGVFDRKNNK